MDPLDQLIFDAIRDHGIRANDFNSWDAKKQAEHYNAVRFHVREFLVANPIPEHCKLDRVLRRIDGRVSQILFD